MSERKVLQKYYPADFDPSAITRVRGPKNAGPKTQTVRLMAPFSMKCTSCGEYIYKGRKFNARKETSSEKYLNIPIYRFYIRCTRCSSEITFKTDPKNMDYTCEKGAKRNFEIWREQGAGTEETDEERLDRLEREEAEMDAMDQLETKMVDAKREMAIADALDEIRTRNARNERISKDGSAVVNVTQDITDAVELEKKRQEAEDEETARKAFARKPLIELADEEEEEIEAAPEPSALDETKEETSTTLPPSAGDKPKEATAAAADTLAMPPPLFKRGIKRKKDFGAALGIKKKVSLI